MQHGEQIVTIIFIGYNVDNLVKVGIVGEYKASKLS